MQAHQRKLMLAGSVICIAASLLPSSAFAQGAVGAPETPATQSDAPIPVPGALPGEVQGTEIIVTGTSIRGAAPVGSNLVTVSAEALAATGAQTVTGALESIPSLSGATGQGQTSAFYQPSIHQLGASASNSTLVLVDGHRGPTGGTNHTFIDPNMIPYNMVQRVDVLAEGASSVYGSDAVAGVINFITLSRFDGVQADAGVTLRNGSTGYQAGLLFGQTWDRGSAVFGATYINQSNLPARERDFTYPDHSDIDLGNGYFGSNYLSRNCSPATIQPASVPGPNNFFPAGSSTPVSSAEASRCTNWDVQDLVGAETRQNIMGKITHDLTDSLTVGLDMVYSRRRGESIGGAGSFVATAFGSGPQANPFYTNPAGVTGDEQTVYFDATDLFGTGLSHSDSDTMYASFTASYEVTPDWGLDFLASAGRDVSSSYSTGQINQYAALLALNGTTNGSGDVTAPSIPGTTVAVTSLPLTAATALDVWNPAGSNRTSQATRDLILDNTNLLQNTSGYQQLRLVANGTLFELPAGPLKVALGGELYRTQLQQFRTRPNAGPSRLNTQQLKFNFGHEVWSAFAELNIPVVGPDMEIPGIRALDLSLAGRYDHYSDFGKTTNPKVAFNWDLFEGLRLRGNWSTSFVSPPLTILGDEYGAFGTASWNPGNRNVTVDTSLFPEIKGTLPGCGATATQCSLNGLNGIQVTTGDPNAGPQEGDGWSLGVDLAPPGVPGLRAAVTYWRTNFTGGVTGAQIEQVLGIKSANYLIDFYPNCATQADIDAATVGIPQAGSLAPCEYYIYRTLNTNWLNLKIGGLDYQLDYDHETDGSGTFSIGFSGTEFLKYRQSFGSGEEYDILNTAGNNGTFASVKRRLRGYVGWSLDSFTARAFVNYTGSFRNWAASSTRNPLERDANGNPEGGGDIVDALTTFDLNLAYDFDDGFLNGSRISLAARNIFDKDPPYFNSSNGYYSLVHNPYGRTVTIALTMKLF